MAFSLYHKGSVSDAFLRTPPPPLSFLRKLISHGLPLGKEAKSECLWRPEKESQAFKVRMAPGLGVTVAT